MAPYPHLKTGFPRLQYQLEKKIYWVPVETEASQHKNRMAWNFHCHPKSWGRICGSQNILFRAENPTRGQFNGPLRQIRYLALQDIRMILKVGLGDYKTKKISNFLRMSCKPSGFLHYDSWITFGHMRTLSSNGSILQQYTFIKANAVQLSLFRARALWLTILLIMQMWTS